MMGSSNDKNTATQNAQSGINTAQQWRSQFQNNLAPVQNTMAYNYGQGSTSDMGNYTDIMNRYRQIAGGEVGGMGGTGGGGGGAGYAGDQSYLTSPGTYTAHNISYDDPFKSYEGYQGFSQTGGYSGTDVANLRARGTAPIRAAYGNAEREVNRQRALGGGYSPNMTAALGKMAREQGQSMADAQQNVEGGIVNQRNANQLAGLGGMSGIEQQRLQAQIAANEFNAQQAAAAEAGNIGANWNLQQANSAIQGRNLNAQQAVANSNAAAGNASAENDMRYRLAALSGMSNLYGTTPGQSATFGNQLLNSIGQQSQADSAYLGAMGNFGNAGQNASRIPTGFQQGMNTAGQFANMATPWINYAANRNQKQPTYNIYTGNNGGFTGQGGNIFTNQGMGPMDYDVNG